MIKQGLILLLVMISYPISAQEWISNEMTEYFADKVILDLSVNEGVIWACSQGIIRADESGFKVYQFDTLSSGRLENFEIEFPGNYRFEEVTSKGKTTYFYDQKRNFIKVENDFVENIYFPIDKYIFNFEVDANGKLWVSTWETKFQYGKESFFIEELYYFNGDGFEKYEFDNEGKNPRSFIFDENKIYTYMFTPDNHYEFDLWVIEDGQVIFKYIPTPKNKLGQYKFDMDNDNIYVKGAGEDFYIIKRNTPEIRVEKYETPFETRDYWDFKVEGNWLYFSDDTGLRRYDYKSDTTEIIHTYYDPRWRFLKNFGMYNDSLLVGQFAAGYGSYSLIPEIGSGIRILKVK